MIFLGSFLSGDELSLSAEPTSVSNINSITVRNVILDALYVTQDTEFETTEEVNPSWDFNTILFTHYIDSVIATNVNWTLDTVNRLIVKRKRTDSYDWTVIDVRDVEKLEDFSIFGTDITPGTGRYEYRVVPCLGMIEGAVESTYVDIEIKKLCLVEMDAKYATLFTDGSCNTVNETPGSFLVTLDNKYPTYVSNTIANYQTITVAGEFYPTEDDCNFDAILNDAERIKYIKDFVTFLTDRRPKLLKSVDGRVWLVMVDNGVTDNMTDFYKTREISFSCVEIGNPDSTEDLCVSGIIDVPQEYWY